ncbi:hypothetical protein [Streptococcus sp. Marseille-P7376]|uniref:hypothetical protein n=1 Tax=Streptococcus sp. Marseille-P7376 TaxID=2592044 RepID=UPI0021CCC5CC|nr:hypothetical protein [Streptococcus sp. Marseille-P7376]
MRNILSNKHAFQFVLASLILIPFIIVGTVGLQQLFKEPEKVEYSIEEYHSVKENVYFFGNQRKFVLVRRGSFGNGTYLYTTERKVMTNKGGVDLTDRTNMPKSDYWKIRLYDYRTEDLAVKEVDLNKVVADYNSSFFPIDLKIFSYRNNPKNVINIEVKDNQGDMKTFVLNIDSGKVEGEYQERSDMYEAGPYFYYTTLDQSAKDKGYLLDRLISIYSDFKAEGKVIDTNINLFEEYPEIEKKITERDWILYPQEEYVTPEEWFDKVLYWMAPKGEEKLTIYGIDTKGQVSDTPLTTYAEYQAWVQKQRSEGNINETN